MSVSVVSKYFITWVCFLYSHLREIDWMPTVDQVKGTTLKLLVECTPNGAISFVSEQYMGLISDVQLTSVSGLLDKLKGKSNISVMVDRGFTV